MLCAADTFRAAAIDQLKIWGGRSGASIIAREPGADSAGLAARRYDAEPGTAYLLRPDGYVAARFRHPTRERLDAALTRAAGHN